VDLSRSRPPLTASLFPLMPLLPMVRFSLRVVSRMSTLLLNRVMGTLDMVCHSFTSKSYFPFSLLLSSSLPAYLGTTKMCLLIPLKWLYPYSSFTHISALQFPTCLYMCYPYFSSPHYTCSPRAAVDSADP
jgi:hypothetical protein